MLIFCKLCILEVCAVSYLHELFLFVYANFYLVRTNVLHVHFFTKYFDFCFRAAMARQRDKSPSLMDADFPMRRHGIQICAENEQSQTSRAVVAEEEEDDDVVFLHETKKKKPSRSNSSSSSTTG